MFHWILLSFLASAPLVTSDFTLHFIYSELKPFVYNNQGIIDGIIPRQYESAVKVCRTLSNQTFHITYIREESYSDFYEKLLHKNLTMEEIFASTNESDMSLTKPELRDYVPFYYPYFMSFNSDDQKLQEPGQVLDAELLRYHQIAIIMRRKHISLIQKSINAAVSTSRILFQTLLFVIIFAIILTLFENFDKFLRGIPVSILFMNVWFTIVTCTTIGYGDRFPQTKIGKLISFFWIVVSLVVVCIFTAAVSGSVFGDTEMGFEGKTISVLNNSNEAELIAINYPESEIAPQKSYRDVIESVVNEDVLAGFLNADYAAWIQGELRYKNIHIVQLLDYEMPINGLTKYHKDNQHLWNCMRKFKRDVLERPIVYFKKECEPERIYYDSIAALYKQNWHMPTITAIILLFIAVAIVHELLACGNLCLNLSLIQNNKNDGISKESEMYQYGKNIEKNVVSLRSDITEITLKLKKT